MSDLVGEARKALFPSSPISYTASPKYRLLEWLTVAHFTIDIGIVHYNNDTNVIITFKCVSCAISTPQINIL